MNDPLTKLESILWPDGCAQDWDARTAQAVAEVLRAEGYGPGGSRRTLPKRGRKAAGMTFSAAVATLVKVIPKAATKSLAWQQTVLVEPGGVRLFPFSSEAYAIVAETGLTESVAVDGKLLAGALQGIGTPALSVRGDALIVTGNGLETSVPIQRDLTAPAGGWYQAAPLEPDFSECVTWQPSIMEALVQVARVASTDSTRPGITRVLVEPEAVVATDGHRLEVRYVSTYLDKPFLLPQDAIALLSSTKEHVTVAVNGKDVWLRSGTFTARVRRERDFPAWRQVLPKPDEATLAVRFNKGALRDFCKRVPKAEVQVQPVIMTLSAHDTAVRLQSAGMRSDDIATCHGNVTQTMHVGFNASYMLALLDGLPGGDFADVRLVDQFTPMVVHGTSMLHVIMPSRI
jgi:hypothetical protein